MKRDQIQKRNEAVRSLRGQGMSQQAIASRMNLSREWVCKILNNWRKGDDPRKGR